MCNAAEGAAERLVHNAYFHSNITGVKNGKSSRAGKVCKSRYQWARNTTEIAMIIRSTCILALLSASLLATPNVIYILADDVGYGDLSCYGQTLFETPNLDRLASDGMRFTEHYSGSAVCAPSRFTLMTGFHIGHARSEGQGQQLRDEGTIAQMLKSVGYATGMIGKWGLGDKTGIPDKQGFDFWYGFLDQRRAHFHYSDWLWRNGEKEELPDNPSTQAQHTQDLFTKEALGFIRQHQKGPFFLYLPYTLIHAELIVPDEYVAPFRETLEDRPEEPKPYGLLHSGYNRPTHRHAAFAGGMTYLDSEIGKVLDLLDELSLSDNTLVIFSSDNGPNSEGGADPRFFNSSGGLHRGKGWLYEGGIRVPMIARWPGRIRAGSETNHPSWFPDVLPTVAEICGAAAKPGIDGISFTATLFGRSNQPSAPYMYWSYNRHRAVRAGKWKLYRFYDAFNDITRYRDSLFDLSQDAAEANDLAATHPERVKDLATRLAQHEHWKK
jgi:arylsulfatase A